MAESDSQKVTIGRAERLSFPEIGLARVHARIDTGARTSAIWVLSSAEREGRLEVVFFAEDSAEPVSHTFDTFEQTAVATSTGHVQKRYKVRLLVKLKGRKIRAWFTLADRSTQVYPVLIGRNVLRGKFIVDVKKGRTLKEAEQKRVTALEAHAKNDLPQEEA